MKEQYYPCYTDKLCIFRLEIFGFDSKMCGQVIPILQIEDANLIATGFR